ncbi:heparinase II/III family protein [Pleionea sediminis]|uniref:heparinase II/III family protein n=1 Tax=Pleionea sediminis TaxID=2569479 RepID=UPI001FE53FAF|nr:alginate lyase family protein [Pleionea sediminis]
MQKAFIQRWIEENPACKGVGWEPYPISLRIVNWVKWMSKQKDVNSLWIQSLIQQADALSQQLEYHILGNHLFANAKALVFIGCFLNSAASERFLKLGLRLLDREVPEQFLKDGGHFELSPMYHQIVLWDLLDLICLAEICQNDELLERSMEWRTIAEGALHWLATMSHPDGEISFFNDSTFGVAPKNHIIQQYAKKLGIERKNVQRKYAVHLVDSGYISLANNASDKLIVDVGTVGPNYQPGHAHADTLSFELSLFNKRVFVNSGISEYGTGKERQFQRSTSAHNTVVVDDKDSSEVWAGFRVARRALTKNIELKNEENSKLIFAEHDGYMRLPGKVIHRRSWDYSENELIVKDNVSGNFTKCSAHFLLHPEVSIVELKNNELLLRVNDSKKITATFYNVKYILIEKAYWYPSFGVSMVTNRIVVEFESSEVISKFRW